MKNMLKMLSISIVTLFSFVLITDAKVKEIDNYTENTFIIGFSRFSGGKAITAQLAAKAGQIYERTHFYIFEKEAEDIKVYMKNKLDGEWYDTKSGTPLKSEEKKELVENLYIFEIDGEEKTFEVPFDGPVDEGTLSSYITYSDKKFTVPASRLWFTFKSNGDVIDVYTKSNYNENLDKEELELGEFEINVYEEPEPPKDLTTQIISQSEKIVEKYYSIKSSYEYKDEEIIDEYYVNVGNYEGELLFNYLQIDGFSYHKDDIGILSVDKNSYIKAPIWKIDENKNLYIALPWLTSDSLPNGNTNISLCNISEEETSCTHIGDVITYSNVSNNVLTVSEANPLFTVNGYKNEVTLDNQPGSTPIVYNTSGHGRHGLGIIIKDSENNDISNENQIIFRKDNNNQKSMAITFPEYNHTYANIPKWQNSEFTTSYSKTMSYRLAIPGKGVIDFEISFTTDPAPLDLKNKMIEGAKKVVDTYYEKESNKIYTEVIDEYYINVGKYQLNTEPTTLSINGQSYSYNINDIGKLSIGRNSFINVPIWKIDENKNILISLPYLASDSLPVGTTDIYVHNNNEGQIFEVITYKDSSDSELALVSADRLFTKDGYISELEYFGNTVNFISGHGHHAYGLILAEKKNNTELVNIIDEDQIIFRKSDDGTMGLTFPDKLGGKIYTYATYPNYYNGAYTTDSNKSYTYKLAIPGKGVIEINFNFETVSAPIDMSERIKNASSNFKDLFYNKYPVGTNSESIINDDNFDDYYIGIGEYTGNIDSLSNKGLTIGDNIYPMVDTMTGPNKTISIGNNVKIDEPVWIIKNNLVYIALPWLTSDSLPNGVTKITVGDQSFRIKTYPSDEGKEITLENARTAYNKDGYMNNLTGSNNEYTYISGHGSHALMFDIKDASGNLIPQGQIIFRKDKLGNMGITLAENTYTYGIYPNYTGSPYTEANTLNIEYRLAIPGYGIIPSLKITFVQYYIGE